MTLRELSERVRDHLTQQRAKSVDCVGCAHSRCAYRGENGTMCAVGCLIADEHYGPGVEGQGAQSQIVMDALKASLGFELNTHAACMLGRWQEYHDAGHGYAEWLNVGGKSPSSYHDERMAHLTEVGVAPDSSAALEIDHGQS